MSVDRAWNELKARRVLNRIARVALFVPVREGWTIAANTTGQIKVFAPVDLCEEPKEP